MIRKLIQHGMSSLTVSLPSKWVKENNLKKGEEVEVDADSGNVIISAKKNYEHKKITVDISDSSPMINRKIGATFKAGYHEIDIIFSNPEELKAVQELVRIQYPGFEIINQEKNKITIKNINENNFEEFPNVIRRLFLVLNQIAGETAQAIKKTDFNWLKNLATLKIESDKFADYCRRAINLGYELPEKRSPPLYTIIEQLDKAVDRYADLCNHISENKIKTSKNLVDLFDGLAEFENDFYTLFYKFDMDKIVDFGRKKESLQEKLDILMKSAPKDQMKILELADRILNILFDLSSPLMTMKI